MTDYEFMLELSDKYYTPLYEYINKICFNKSLVSDIIQDTFLIAYQKADKLQNHENLSGWLYLTARHRMLQIMAEYLNYNYLDSAEALSDGHNYEDECIAIADLYPVISQYTTPDELSLILGHYKDGYTFHELAEKYDMTESSIKMKTTRAKKKLRRAFYKKKLEL